jgi:hypothetical protein
LVADAPLPGEAVHSLHDLNQKDMEVVGLKSFQPNS